MYKLPSLPGTNPGQSRGYSITDRSLSAPANSTTHTPNFGSAGIATTFGAEYVYVASPAGPQGTPQLTALYGVPAVYVYRVRTLFAVTGALPQPWHDYHGVRIQSGMSTPCNCRPVPGLGWSLCGIPLWCSKAWNRRYT